MSKVEEEYVLYFIGIDIAKRNHVVGIRQEDGQPCGNAFSFSNDEAGFKSLMERLGASSVDAQKCIVGMEATGHYWLALYSFLTDHGFDVAVINPIQTDAFRKTQSIRKTKTDAIDAFMIAEFTRFGGSGLCRVAPEDTEGLKYLTRYRMHLVSEVTSLKNRATAILDRIFPEYETLFSPLLSPSSMHLLETLPTPQDIAGADIRTVERLLREGSRGRFGRKKADELKALAKTTVGVSFAAQTLGFELAHIIKLIRHLEGEVGNLNDKIACLLEKTTGKWLTSIPGIGEVFASVITAEIGDANRFEAPNKLIAYAGIDSSKNQSGEFDGTKAHMSKRGSPYLRWALIQAADSVRKQEAYFGDYYDSMKARGKHHYVALSGVARKLAGLILALMKEERAYESRPAIQPKQASKST